MTTTAPATSGAIGADGSTAKSNAARNIAIASEKNTVSVSDTNASGAGAATGPATTASKTLQYLLREDPQLENFNLTHLNLSSKKEGSFAYAAALINVDNQSHNHSGHDEDGNGDGIVDWSDASIAGEIQQKARDALSEVERKLILVESLSERISREKPEHVAEPLMKLHGYTPYPEEKEDNDNDNDNGTGSGSGGGGAMLTSTLERCDRLSRQSQVLDSVAHRVESTLVRGLDRMTNATDKLERVLKTSQVLKMVMRLKFEAKKVMGAGLGITKSSTSGISGDSGLDFKDLRDLTRAAASVAVMEELLNHPDLKDQGIDMVDQMRPEAERVAKAVRKAAANLLADQHQHGQGHGHGQHNNMQGMGRLSSAAKLGATLQVYFHLGELPDAAWNAVCLGLDKAEKASGRFFNPSAIKRLLESAKTEARYSADQEINAILAGGGDRNKKQKEVIYNRVLYTKHREKKAEAASLWASEVAACALQVYNLHRVLMRKSDPVSRQNFLEVVCAAPVPDDFKQAQELYDNAKNGGAASDKMTKKKKVSIFTLFWNQMCISLGARMQRLLKYENGAMASDVATFYPAVRAAALEMLSSIQDTMQAGVIFSSDEMSMSENGSGMGMVGGGSGIMGGSLALDDATFFGFSHGSHNKNAEGGATSASTLSSSNGNAHDGDLALGGVSADTWTKKDTSSSTNHNSTATVMDKIGARGKSGHNQMQTSSAVSSILSSPEWQSLQGLGSGSGLGRSNGNGNADSTTMIGLYPMQGAFLRALHQRLEAPLHSLFVENRVVDENGIDIKMLPTLPSNEDLQQLETIIRAELSLSDPREGGGDFSMTTMISECIVEIVERVCSLARGATSGASEDELLHTNNNNKSASTATEELLHDMKVAGVLATLTNHLRTLPDNTFVVPYRPAHSLQHEEAANMCQIALLPAVHEIDSMVKSELLNPLTNVLNKGIASEIAKMHRGAYMDHSSSDSNSYSNNDTQGSFVQDYLAPKYDDIATNILARLPGEYGGKVACTICTFSIYTFLTNASLIRPLGEMGRLRITQDLADLELTLEQLIFKGGGSTPLNQISGGKPYAELRAVRQMLFWGGLENKTLSSEQVSKAFFREVWVKDVRPSTAFHFLFTFAPALLSSPHHACRMNAEEYTGNLVKFDGSVDDGEAKAWMTTMNCCDAYQQRESIDGGVSIGDRRVPAILMIVGPELLRRRRY